MKRKWLTVVHLHWWGATARRTSGAWHRIRAKGYGIWMIVEYRVVVMASVDTHEKARQIPECITPLEKRSCLWTESDRFKVAILLTGLSTTAPYERQTFLLAVALAVNIVYKYVYVLISSIQERWQYNWHCDKNTLYFNTHVGSHS